MTVKSWQLTTSWLLPVLGLGLIGLGLGSILGQEYPAIAGLSQTNDPPRRLAPPVGPLNMATSRQGNTVTIGNVTSPIPWQQQGDRIGLADIPLMRHLGVDLQNTQDPGQQPIVWFSDQPQSLPTWYASGYRYVDITDWAPQQGWQLQPRGDSLRIQASPGTVLQGRRGQQAWGDRLVLEVDRPVLWTLAEEPNTFTLTLQANTAASFKATALTAGEGNLLETLQLRSARGQLQIQGTFDDTARPRIWSLTNPHRVVIDLTQTTVVPRDILWAPGLRWRDEYRNVGGRPFPVHQLWLDLEPNLALQSIWPNRNQLPGTAPLVATAQDWGAVAAINGGFFNRNNQLPLGAIRSQGRWISGPILNRGAIAWDSQGPFRINRLFLSHSLTTSQELEYTVSHINSGYVQAGIALYTSAWGSTYTPIIDDEILVTVHQNQVLRQENTGAAGTGAYEIPAEGYLLAVRADSEAARSLLPGTPVTLTPEVRPAVFGELPYAIGGGPLLVSRGQSVVNATVEGFSDAFAAQAAPRSAVGVTAEGTLLLAAIHDSPGGRGPTLQETAQIMMQLGAQEALNLDGGSSSSLYLGGSLINRHSGTVGQVHNGLGIFLTSTEQ